MKTQHTPGPWKASRISRNYGCYGQQIQFAGPTAHWNTLPHNKEVALVLTDSPEDRANARLMAAAPDLLEALQRIHDDPYTTCGCGDIARKAITKATVES